MKLKRKLLTTPNGFTNLLANFFLRKIRLKAYLCKDKLGLKDHIWIHKVVVSTLQWSFYSKSKLRIKPTKLLTKSDILVFMYGV